MAGNLITPGSIQIELLRTEHEAGIATLYASIEAEFSEPSHLSARNIRAGDVSDQYTFWVALSGNRVVGTVALLLIGNKTAVLKSMMVHREFRGMHYRTAQQLLDTATAHAIANGAQVLYLGTMIQFKAAQRFYERNGFIQISAEALPEKFVANPVDKLFYMKPLQD